MTTNEIRREIKRIRRNFVERKRYHSIKGHTNTVKDIEKQIKDLEKILSKQRITTKAIRKAHAISHFRYESQKNIDYRRNLALLNNVILKSPLYNLNPFTLNYYENEFKRLLGINIQDYLLDVFQKIEGHFASGDEYEGLFDMFADIQSSIVNIDDEQEELKNEVIQLYEKFRQELE